MLKALERKVLALRDERDRLLRHTKPAPLKRQPRISIEKPVVFVSGSPTNTTTSGTYTTGELQEILESMQTIYVYEDGMYKPIN